MSNLSGRFAAWLLRNFALPRRLLSAFLRHSAVEIYAFNPRTGMMRRVSNENHLRMIARGMVSDVDSWAPKVEPLLEGAGLVVDVGACEGYTSAWFAERAEQVYAFEPHPGNFAAMSRMHGLRNIRNVTRVPLAVSDRTGKAELFVKRGTGHHALADIGASRTIRKIEIACTTLDDFFAGNEAQIALLKIDAEGFELEVLTGASRLLSERRIDAILFEYMPAFSRQRGMAPARVAEFVEAQGYTLHDLDMSLVMPDTLGEKRRDVIALRKAKA